MKVIKFQLFDKDAQVMREVLEIDFEHNYAMCKDGTDKFHYDLDIYNLRQYTGLKDKNGKEIYEGDIYKWFGHEVRDSRQIRPIRIEEVKLTPEGIYRIYCLMDGNGTLEVIGNIYENADLLTLREASSESNESARAEGGT